MHPSFVAKLRPVEVVDDRGNVKLVVDKNNPSPVIAYSAAAQPEAELTTAAVSVNVPLPRSAPQAKVGARPAEEQSFSDRLASFFRGGGSSSSSAQAEQRVAAAEPAAPKAAPKREGIKARVSRMIGLRGSNDQAQSADAAAPAAPVRSASPKVKTASASSESQPPAAPAPAPAAAPSNGGVISGSQPIPPSSNNFDNRWSAFR